MDICGLNRFSLIDYPGKICAIVFTGGCNFSCPYCHNAVLVCDPTSQEPIAENVFFDFLDTRIGKLDGVVVSGGEPTLQSDLPEFVAQIKQRGFLVKIDTNGSDFATIKRIFNDGCLDALGVDFKAPFEKYPQITGSDERAAENMQKVVNLAVEQGITLDLRTTVHKALLSVDDLRQMRDEIDKIDPEIIWILQQFNFTADILDDELLTIPTYSDNELLAIAESLNNTRVRSISGLLI